MVIEQITVDLDAVVGSLFRELFPREQEVARWIGLELTNKRIAREIGATELTAKAHLSNIC